MFRQIYDRSRIINSIYHESPIRLYNIKPHPETPSLYYDNYCHTDYLYMEFPLFMGMDFNLWIEVLPFFLK
jgi:hypothetical protein